MWRADVFTLFPAMFPGALGLSLAGDALSREVWSCEAFDIRAHGLGRHRAVDDKPAGGGPGMVMRADVVAAALDAHTAANDGRPRLLMSPRGRPLTQSFVRELANGPGVVAVCGRFEGVDERVIEARNLIEISIGDYVLSGGELAALVLLDACVRLLPGVMGAETSGTDESFERGLLEYPHYTRPRAFEGRGIPEVLLNGDHAKIAAWRRAAALRVTEERRPDLLARPETDGSSARPEPGFVADYTVEALDCGGVTLRHLRENHRWRFGIAEKNGRRLLLHADHEANPAASREIGFYAVDAYDAATRKARESGLVD